MHELQSKEKSMKIGKLVICAISAASVLGCSAAEFTLVENGKPNVWIQMNPVPSAQEYLAATELQTYIKKISGANVKRKTTPGSISRMAASTSKDTVEIMLVTLENGKRILPEETVRKLEKSSSAEAFHLFGEDSPQSGKTVYIAGKTPGALLYGAYAFLEDYLGVRFFHAGPEGEYCPKKKTIRLEKIDDFREPWLKTRRMSCWSGSVAPWKMEDVETWLTRRAYHWNINHNYNDLTRKKLDHAAGGNLRIGGGGHLTFELSIPKRLFQSRPELFPLQKGKRVCNERSQRCLSNPEVKKMVTDYIARHTAYGASFRINFHDSTDGWCECPSCIRYGTGPDGKYSLSNLAHRFTVEVAQEVRRRNPDAELSFMSYSDYRNLPGTPLAFPQGLLCIYCPHQRCYVHALNDPKAECNASFLKQFNEWRTKTSAIGIFDYYAYSQSPYCPLEYTLAKDMRFYRDCKLDTWIEDCTNKLLPIPASNWQFYYAASKLAWNADLDIDKLFDEAYTLYYGAAAEPMKKYHAYRRTLWESVPGHASYGGPRRYAYCLTVAGAEKRLTSYLAEAEKLAGNDAVLRSRIAMDRKFLRDYWIAEAEKIRKNTTSSGMVPVSRRNSPVKIDGNLDEEAWRSAQFVTPFLTLKGKHEPVEETRVKVLYDNDAWYIGVEAMTEHAWSKLVADVRTRDGAVWQDDSVELFLAPPNAEYYHLVVNSIGTLYDARSRNTAFDSGAEIKTRTLKDRYVVEMRIPVKPMEQSAIRDGAVWQLHFGRNCRNLQPPKSAETSTLDAIPPHEQTMFRRTATGISVLADGSFTREKPVPENRRKTIFSETFPAAWGANLAKLAKRPGDKNVIELQDVIYSMLRLPRNGKATKVAGEILASGKGKITVTLSGCIRPAGDKRPFGHEKKMRVAEFPLTEKSAGHKIAFETEPDFMGYLYIRVQGGNAVIESVSLSR